MASKQNQTKQNKRCPLGPLIPCQILRTLQENKGKLGKGKHSLSKAGGLLGIRDEESSPFITLNSPANIGWPTCV